MWARSALTLEYCIAPVTVRPRRPHHPRISVRVIILLVGRLDSSRSLALNQHGAKRIGARSGALFSQKEIAQKLVGRAFKKLKADHSACVTNRNRDHRDPDREHAQ